MATRSALFEKRMQAALYYARKKNRNRRIAAQSGGGYPQGAPDASFADVAFLSGLDGASPSDESSLSQAVTVRGTAQLSTEQTLFGQKTLKIAAANDAISVPDNAAFTLAGQTPFTIDLWAYPLGFVGDSILISQYDASDELGWVIRHYVGAGIWFEFYEPGWYGGVGSDFIPTNNDWNHISVDFDGVNFRIYGGGTMHGKETHASIVSIGDIADAAAPLMMGSANDGGSGFTGYLFDGRFTVGTARYANDAGFAVPTAPYSRS